MINIIKTLYLKYFELTSAICATLIIVLAILMEKLLYLNACNLCILARFAFAGIALVSFSAHFFKKYQLAHKLFNIFFSLSGLVFMGRQIMLQNLPEEEVMMLEGCGLPSCASTLGLQIRRSSSPSAGRAGATYARLYI